MAGSFKIRNFMTEKYQTYFFKWSVGIGIMYLCQYLFWNQGRKRKNIKSWKSVNDCGCVAETHTLNPSFILELSFKSKCYLTLSLPRSN